MRKGKRTRKRGPKSRYHKKILYPPALEVSIVGGGLERFRYDGNSEVTPGKFAFIKFEEGEEHLVKLRGISRKPTDKKILGFRPATSDVVKNVMKRIVRKVLHDENYDDIKIVRVDLDTEVGHAVFTYIAEKKYSLSKLAASLAKILHVKVSFEQIGARDYARVLGGLGLCGRPLCCRIMPKEIPSVTLEMARQQYLFAAPEKLSGLCGRLLCCLRFELPVYEEMLKNLPPLGARVETRRGVGKVIEVNALLSTFKVQYEDDTIEIIKADEEGAVWEILK